jgi:flavin-dependent dehydrogenase
MKRFDVIVIGGGPGGSTLAALLAKQGRSVAVFERETFPRFHIGESLLPSTMPIFKETGFYDTLAGGDYLLKYGARFLDYRCEDEVYFGFENGFNADIPMAFEVERAQFDQEILAHAQKLGAEVFQPERVKDVALHADHVVVTTNKDKYEGAFVVDATGRESLLGKQMSLREKHQDLNNVAVFAHYGNVRRNPGRDEGDIIVSLLPEKAWSWIIPFKGEKTSVGIVCNAKAYRGGVDMDAYLQSNFDSSPRLKFYMEKSERISEVTMISNYSFHSNKFCGERWILLGDSAVFLDPIFSSGVHVSVTSAKLASIHIMDALKTGTTLQEAGRAEQYQRDLQKGVDRFHHLISMFYNENFVHQMKRTLELPRSREMFTSAVAGDMWNDDNPLFNKGVL